MVQKDKEKGVKFDPLWVAQNIARGWLSVAAPIVLSSPISVNLLLTTRCNSRCRSCDLWRLKESDILTLDDLSRLAIELRALGVPYLTIAGGEPLLRRDIVEIVALFSQAGLMLQMTTNGINLNPQMAKRLIEAGLNSLGISIDAVDREMYKAIRCVDRLPKVLANVDKLLELRKGSPLAVEANVVVSSLNIDTIEQIFNELHQRGFDRICLSPVVTTGENNLLMEDKPDLGIPPAKADKLADFVLKNRKKLNIGGSLPYLKGLKKWVVRPDRNVYPCLAGYYTMDINSDGTVTPCGWLPSMGNIRSQSLKSIWNSKAYQRVRRQMLRGQCPQCYLSCKTEISIASNPRHLLQVGIERLKRQR